jgi:hypothetical protein
MRSVKTMGWTRSSEKQIRAKLSVEKPRERRQLEIVKKHCGITLVWILGQAVWNTMANGYVQ